MIRRGEIGQSTAYNFHGTGDIATVGLVALAVDVCRAIGRRFRFGVVLEEFEDQVKSAHYARGSGGGWLSCDGI